MISTTQTQLWETGLFFNPNPEKKYGVNRKYSKLFRVILGGKS